jgi:large subunit ribosomal protein L4e
VGAEVSQTRGGRSAHPPLGLHSFRKINSKEMTLAFQTGFASTAYKELIIKRYSSLQNTKEIPQIPFVIESLPQKTKDLNSILEKLLGQLSSIAFKKKEVRTGKGKRRGRKYKSTAGLLIIKGRNEKSKFSGVEVKNAQEILMRDLYPLGRLTLYTQQGLKELEEKYA